MFPPQKNRATIVVLYDYNLQLTKGVFTSGVESFDIDLESQKVTVKANIPPETVLQAVSKTGKATSFWEAGEPGSKST
ncbi:hypothetical protein SASPL_123556 [Salvia splendens]|uniref:HMA domain-containing protein n=1 Tax=Salvia splendens TaxID=180675 RepID=A0A8X8ZS58_SALSN|nr:hypothetical protein SASPL_123556 [Salvia splendens]